MLGNLMGRAKAEALDPTPCALPLEAIQGEKKRKRKAKQAIPTKNVPDGHIRFPIPNRFKKIGRSSARAGLTAKPIYTTRH